MLNRDLGRHEIEPSIRCVYKDGGCNVSYFDSIRNSVAQFGVICSIHDLAAKAANRVILFKVFRGATVERFDPAFLECPEPCRPMFLDATMLRAFAKCSETLLAEEFLGEALSKGDEC
jgi:hypothetical protein